PRDRTPSRASGAEMPRIRSSPPRRRKAKTFRVSVSLQQSLAGPVRALPLPPQTSPAPAIPPRKLTLRHRAQSRPPPERPNTADPSPQPPALSPEPAKTSDNAPRRRAAYHQVEGQACGGGKRYSRRTVHD